VRIVGRRSYLYRAVDSTGETIDFVLSPNRDLIAAKLFLRLALSGANGVRPRVINVDGHPTYARAIAEFAIAIVAILGWLPPALPRSRRARSPARR
jgi:transposase-like protein